MPEPAPVLVVNSDPFLRSEMIATLSRAKVNGIIAASTALEAYQRLDDSRPRAAVVDVGLTGTGGLTAAFHLITRAKALNLTMPVFLITPIDGEAIETAAKAIGAAGVIAWPGDWQKLAEFLASMPI